MKDAPGSGRTHFEIASHKFPVDSNRSTKKPILTAFVVGAVVLIFLVVAFVMSPNENSSRSQSYKKSTGSAAGLAATITYDCHKCKPTFDFNIYIFKSDGQQVNVIRPDKDGEANAALPEGNYVMLIGRHFGKDRLFPQEPIALKDGKELDLKLHYKEETL